MTISPRTHTTPLPLTIFLCPLDNVKIMRHGLWKALRYNFNMSCDTSFVPSCASTLAIFDSAVTFPGHPTSFHTLNCNSHSSRALGSIHTHYDELVILYLFLYLKSPSALNWSHTALIFAYFCFAILWGPPNWGQSLYPQCRYIMLGSVHVR